MGFTERYDTILQTKPNEYLTVEEIPDDTLTTPLAAEQIISNSCVLLRLHVQWKPPTNHKPVQHVPAAFSGRLFALTILVYIAGALDKQSGALAQDCKRAVNKQHSKRK